MNKCSYCVYWIMKFIYIVVTGILLDRILTDLIRPTSNVRTLT